MGEGTCGSRNSALHGHIALSREIQREICVQFHYDCQLIQMFQIAGRGDTLFQRENSVNTAHQPAQQDEDEPLNDEIVVRAIRASLIFLLLAAVLGLGFWFLNRPQPKLTEQTVIATELPEVRELPQLRVPSIPWKDETDSAGIDFVHENGAEGEKLLPETMGGGGAFLDFDSDGDQDVFCVNSNVWPWAKVKPASPPVSALYQNDGTGKFVNVTADSGLDIPIYGNGVACGDFDNDGRTDIYITAVGQNHLFHNEGNGKFKDVTAPSGVGGPNDSWSTGAGWFDLENDGDLDLFVCNYIEWTREKDLSMEFTLQGKSRAYGRPTDFTGAFPNLYRNEGNGTFTDVSEEYGIQIRNPDTGTPLSKSLGVTFSDVNNDGRLDIFVANDTVQNLLYLSQADGKFAEAAATSGVAFDNNGAARGAMGIDAAWFRNSEAVGVAIGNFANEMTALYVCQTPGTAFPIFRDEAVSSGIGPVTRVELTFGVLFFDADLDGRLDLFSCNGHLEEDIQTVMSSQQYEQPPQLLWNCGDQYPTEFMVVSEKELGSDFTKRMVGRGATMADIDNDGDMDLLLFASGGKPRLLRNEQQLGNHWLRLQLRGTTCNRDAIGAVVAVTLPDNTILRRNVMPTRSYQSQTELPMTFGLGKFDKVQSVTINWPGGESQELTVDGVDRMITVEQKASL